jgi:hypothetical protein
MPTKVAQGLLFVLLLLGTVALLAVVGLRMLRRTIARSILGGMPRDQPLIFRHRLREAFFRNPFAVMTLLFSDGRVGYLQKLWKEAKPPPRHAGFEPGLPPDEIGVFRTHLQDGRAIAVVILPPPQRRWEPWFIALVLPQDQRLRDDVLRARRHARFFTLDRGSTITGHRNDLRGWTHDGKERFYNTDAPVDPERFAAVVSEKMRELRQ